MAELIPNRKIEGSSFKIVKVSQEAFKDSRDIILENYLAGNLILIEKYLPEVDINQFNFPALQTPNYMPDNISSLTNKYKDISHWKIKKAQARTAAQLIHTDKKKAEILLATMHSVEKQVGNLFYQLFQVPITSYSTWRFTRTNHTIYHLDDYNGILLRAFWNLSTCPRVWNIGHNSNDIIKLFGNKVSTFLQESAKQTRGEITTRKFNRYLNTLIQDCERHTIKFDQYDLWLIDSVKVVHQLKAGDKLGLFNYKINEVSKLANTIVERLNYPNYIRSSIENVIKKS